MSFRTRQKLKMSSTAEIYSKEDRTLENGEIVTGYATTVKDMPDPEMFRLSNQLKAGVDLQEVNSRVLGAKSIDLSKVFEYKQDKKEVNNEN